MEEDKVLNFFKGDLLASNVWSGKYKFGDEQTPIDMFERHVGEVAAKEYQRLTHTPMSKSMLDNMSEYGKKYYGRLFNDEHLEQRITSQIRLHLNFDGSVLGGSMMQGIGNHKLFSSLSNCFVLGEPFDSYSGINKKEDELSQVMKRRGGGGLDLSSIRPMGATVHNQASSSSGVVPFADGYSSKTKQVAQQGRRGALMLSLHINHPDSLHFILSKQDNSKITGANISVKLPDEFMEAVEADSDYILRWPVTNSVPADLEIEKMPYNDLWFYQNENEEVSYFKRIRAKEYWETIIKCAHATAEPGILFIGNWEKGGLDYCYDKYRPISTNPCFAGNMNILTKDGYKTFLELNGKTDIDFINKNGQVVKGRVWSNGVKSVYETKFYKNTHKSIRTTKDHHFMLQDGTEQEISKSVGKRIRAFGIINQEISEYTKYGFIQGDGNLGRLKDPTHLGLEVCIGKEDEDIAKMFGLHSKWKSNDDARYSFRITGYNDIFRTLKFSEEKLPTRVLPLTFKDWKVEDQLMFLKGVFSANGSITKSANRISLKTSCEQFANELKFYLESFGIKVTITNNPAQTIQFSNGIGNCKASFNVTISERESVITFAEKIGFVHSYKQQLLEDIIINRSPIVSSSAYVCDEEVFDFELFDDCHWGVIEGLVGHNCSEIPMQPFDACRLIARNLYKLVYKPFSKDAQLAAEEEIYEAFYIQFTINDILVDLELDYLDRIINKIKAGNDPEDLKRSEYELWEKIKAMAASGRRCGSGFTALGDMFAALGSKYFNPELGRKIFKIKLKAELDASIDMAIKYGAFDGYSTELEENTHYIKNVIAVEFPEQYARMRIHGRRNVSHSTAAPVGTGGIMTQATSGIEPIFKVVYKRRKKCVSPGDRVDFTNPDDGEKFTEYFTLHPKFVDWYIISELDSPEAIDDVPFFIKTKTELENLSEADMDILIRKSPWFGNTADDLNWNERVEMQAIVQRYTTHAISSTINLPSNCSTSLIGNIYMESWKQGLKGNTVYRDGCREGILVSNEKTPRTEIEFTAYKKIKRPKKLQAHYHTLKFRNKTYSIIIGLMNERPYEIFIISGIPNIPIVLDEAGEHINGEIVKDYTDWYNFVSPTFTVKDIGDVEGDEKLISLMLSGLCSSRTPIDTVIKILEKSKPIAGSFTHRLVKILGHYVEGPTGEKCPECGGPMKRENGCVLCVDCGWTKC